MFREDQQIFIHARERRDEAGFLLPRGDDLVFSVVRVCAHVSVCVCFWKGKERESIMMVEVYNHSYSKAEDPSLICVGISINRNNCCHNQQRQQQNHPFSSPIVTCLDFPRSPVLVSRISNLLELEDF